MTSSSSSEKKSRPVFSIKVAQTKDELEACWDLRVEVFIVEQGFSIDDERDQLEDISEHFLLVVEETSAAATAPASILGALSASAGTGETHTTRKPVGTIRFTPSLGKVSRLVVLKEYRSYGFGRELVQAVTEHASRLGREDVKDALVQVDGEERLRLKLHSQMQVIPFYSSLGYSPVGDVFDEDGAPHQKMIQDIRLLQQ